MLFLQGLHFLMHGGPIMWPLLLCAVLSLAVMIERALYFASLRSRLSALPPGEPVRRGLSALDTIITVAPLLGLLGTVTGMIKAFGVLNTGNDAGPTVITGGVAEALIATATGLAIAIATLVGYNILTERAQRLASAGNGRRYSLGRPMKKARIEIIPMIDTIFFLLVYFIIESLSMVHLQSRKVSLPSSTTAQVRPETNAVVTLTADGEYYVDHQPVTELDIRPLIAARISQDPTLTVVLNCDRSQPMARFARLLDLVKQADAGRVMIATTPDTSLRVAAAGVRAAQ